jgi:hypothetical protein
MVIKSPKAASAAECLSLEQLPNVGPAIAADLRLIGIERPPTCATRMPGTCTGRCARRPGAPGPLRPRHPDGRHRLHARRARRARGGSTPPSARRPSARSSRSRAARSNRRVVRAFFAPSSCRPARTMVARLFRPTPLRPMPAPALKRLFSNYLPSTACRRLGAAHGKPAAAGPATHGGLGPAARRTLAQRGARRGPASISTKRSATSAQRRRWTCVRASPSPARCTSSGTSARRSSAWWPAVTTRLGPPAGWPSSTCTSRARSKLIAARGPAAPPDESQAAVVSPARKSLFPGSRRCAAAARTRS